MTNGKYSALCGYFFPGATSYPLLQDIDPWRASTESYGDGFCIAQWRGTRICCSEGHSVGSDLSWKWFRPAKDSGSRIEACTRRQTRRRQQDALSSVNISSRDHKLQRLEQTRYLRSRDDKYWRIVYWYNLDLNRGFSAFSKSIAHFEGE
jgi:hypothetical protein